MYRLEDCEVCNANKAKYTCPKCEVRTCGIECVNIHKKELDCNGIRDRTKFIQMNNFTDLDLLSDYRMLEQIGRSIEKLKTDPSKKCTKQRELPAHLYKLRSAAFQKGTFLHLMPQNFTRHKENTTYLNFKNNMISWRIEWIFPQAEQLKWISERVSENEILADVLSQIWNPIDENSNDPEEFDVLNEKLSLKNKLQYYHAANFPEVKIFLKAEKVQNCKMKFFELDAESSFRENFKKRNIVEFPTLHVVLKSHCDGYEIIDTDDETSEQLENEVEEEKKETFFSHNTNKFNGKRKRSFKNKRPHVKTDKKVKEKSQINACNYFFNGDVSDSDDEN